MAEKHYLSAAELRKISRENMKITAAYEKKKKQKVDPATYETEMHDPNNVLEIEDLHTFFFTDAGVVKSVNGVSFEIPQGKIVGVVGESGCGKSVTSLSVMQLVQAPQGQIVDGSIRFRTSELCLDENNKPIPVWELDENGEPLTEEVTDKRGRTTTVKVQKKDKDGFPVFERQDKVVDIAKMPTADMRKIRGREISMIFQEPMTSLNPVFTIGYQLDEVILVNTPGATRKDAKEKSIKMLGQVGIAAPEAVYAKYPHELSGGMRQRVMIAMAIACNPKAPSCSSRTTSASSPAWQTMWSSCTPAESSKRALSTTSSMTRDTPIPSVCRSPSPSSTGIRTGCIASPGAYRTRSTCPTPATSRIAAATARRRATVRTRP